MTTDRETLGVYADRAHDYAEQFASDRPGKHLSAFVDDLPAGARVLDLGCGPGQAAAYMTKLGFQVDAWDASPEMANVGQRAFGVPIEVKGFDALEAEAVYDGIYANFSLLHAPKAEMPGHLARISRGLKPGGVFHIGLKTGKGEKRDTLGRFYAFYEEPEMTDLLEEASLTVYSRAFGKDVGLAGANEPWMILRAKKND